MGLTGFPRHIRVVLGTAFTGGTRFHGLTSGDILILSNYGPLGGGSADLGDWTETGEIYPSAANRIAFRPSQFSNATVLILGQLDSGTSWGVGSIAGFKVNLPSFSVGTDYVFKEIWNTSPTNADLAIFTQIIHNLSYNGSIFSSFDEYIPGIPVADFTADVVSGAKPLTVNFTDTSYDFPTSWAWDFGDSGISTVKNPQHIYSTPGTYTVALTATNASGDNTKTKIDYITVTTPAPVADFTADHTSGVAPLTVQFTDTSTNTPTSWSWSFGDTGSATTKNPQHIYSTAGTYTVALTATNAGGSDTETKIAYITVTSPSVTPPAKDRDNRSPNNTFGMGGTSEETPYPVLKDSQLGGGISDNVNEKKYSQADRNRAVG